MLQEILTTIHILGQCRISFHTKLFDLVARLVGAKLAKNAFRVKTKKKKKKKES